MNLTLLHLESAIDAEVEFVARHLQTIERTFAERWDQLHGPPDDRRVRWVDGQFSSIPALYVVEARLSDQDVIELRNIRIVLDPEVPE